MITVSECLSIIIMTANKHGNMQVCVVLEKDLCARKQQFFAASGILHVAFQDGILVFCIGDEAVGTFDKCSRNYVFVDHDRYLAVVQMELRILSRLP